jgi:hypothetical protein
LVGFQICASCSRPTDPGITGGLLDFEHARRTFALGSTPTGRAGRPGREPIRFRIG